MKKETGGAWVTGYVRSLSSSSSTIQAWHKRNSPTPSSAHSRIRSRSLCLVAYGLMTHGAPNAGAPTSSPSPTPKTDPNFLVSLPAHTPLLGARPTAPGPRSLHAADQPRAVSLHLFSSSLSLSSSVPPHLSSALYSQHTQTNTDAEPGTRIPTRPIHFGVRIPFHSFPHGPPIVGSIVPIFFQIPPCRLAADFRVVLFRTGADFGTFLVAVGRLGQRFFFLLRV